MVDGVAFKAREHVGNCVVGIFDVLDDDLVFKQRCYRATNARAGSDFFLKHPGTRLVVSTPDQQADEEVEA